MRHNHIFFGLLLTSILLISTGSAQAHRTDVDLLETEAAKTIVLTKLGGETGKLISKEKGLELFGQALTASASITNPAYREAALAQIANELAALGATTKAIAITREFRDIHLYVTTLGKIAQKLSGEDKAHALLLLEEAVRKARTATDKVDMAALLAEMAGKYEKVGQHAISLQLLQEAGAMADGITNTDLDEKVALLAEIAANLIAAGQQEQAAARFEEATMLTHKIKDAFEKAACLSMLGGELAEKGQPAKALLMLEQARQVAEQIKVVAHRNDILSEIARNFSQAKDCDKAASIAGTINDGYFRVEALIRIAKNYQKQQQGEKAISSLQEAKNIAASISNPLKKSMVLAKIATEFADSKQLSEAHASLSAATALVSNK